jgi:hypothetical protein
MNGCGTSANTDAAAAPRRYSLYLLYWYKSANTDAAAAQDALIVSIKDQFTCFTGTKVQILTLLLLHRTR